MKLKLEKKNSNKMKIQYNLLKKNSISNEYLCVCVCLGGLIFGIKNELRTEKMDKQD